MKIKYWVPILLIIFIFSFTGCTTPKTDTETATAETSIAEITTSETTEPVTTIPETTTSETTATTAATVSEAPTIKLSISEGPNYSSSDDVCYYRVKATVTGNPSLSITFSKIGGQYYDSF